jgi:hypothetical protein
MRTRTPTILASLVAAFALVATASLAGGAAPAHADYLKNTDIAPDYHTFLRFPPKVPSFKPCVTDSVTLAPGDYVHGAYIVSQRHRTKPDLENAPSTLTVRARTTYNWEVCRKWNPDPNPASFERAAYQVTSRLLRRGFKHEALMTFQNELGRPAVVYGPGNYEWGGRIAWACTGCTSPSR